MLVARRRRRRRRRGPRCPSGYEFNRSQRRCVKIGGPQGPDARTTATAAPAAGASSAGLRRGARVEFDGRLVQGQTAKSGAIYLFARKRGELRSMVQERTHYRTEVLRTLYPNLAAKVSAAAKVQTP